VRNGGHRRGKKRAVITAQISEEQAKKNAARVDRLGTEKIGKLLWEFGVPATVASVISALYNIIDSMFLGQGVGPIGLATATVAAPIMTIFIAIGILIGNGGNALIAITLGEGKKKEAEKILGNTFVLAVVASLLVVVLGLIFMDPILSISGATDETWGPSTGFIRIILAGFLFQTVGFGLNNFIRTAGEPNRALWTVAIGTLVCIALNYLFVMVLHFGVNGSALATVLGQSVTCAVVLWYFIRSPKCPFRLHREGMRVDFHLWGRILTLGSAACILQIAMSVCLVVLNNMLVIYGAGTAVGIEGAQAAIGVVQRVAQFAVFPIIGVAIAAQPIFGYNYGARKFDRVKETLRKAITAGVVIGLFFFALVHLIPGPIAALFGITGDLMDFTVKVEHIQFALIFLAAVQIIGSNYFQATGQPGKSVFLSLTRQLLYLIPCYLLMPIVLPALFGFITPLEGVVYAIPISDALSTITAVFMLLRERKRINRLQAEDEAARNAADGDGGAKAAVDEGGASGGE